MTTGLDALPHGYRFLANETGAPPLLIEALKLYGVREYPGAADNPAIIAWRSELCDAHPNLAWIREVYSGDAVPWCGLFMAYAAHRAGHGAPQPRFLAARSWQDWGEPVQDAAELGDALVFWRDQPDGRSGHVGIYVGEDDGFFHVLGGNQSDSVSFTRIRKTRLLEARRPAPVPHRPVTGWRGRIYIDPGAADVTENEA